MPDPWMTLLRAVCSTEEYRPYLHHPFLLNGWTMATDGKVAVAIHEERAGLPAVPDEIGNVGLLHEIVTTEPDTRGYEFPLDALRDWCGEPRPTCPVCDGEGLTLEECKCDTCGNVHDAVCTDCEGDGILPLWNLRDEDRVTFEHHRLNRRLLGWMLEHAPGESVTLWPNEASQELMVFVQGDGWRGAIMPLRHEEDKQPVGDLVELVGAHSSLKAQEAP